MSNTSLIEKIDSFFVKQVSGLVPQKVLIRGKDGKTYYATRYKRLAPKELVRYFDTTLNLLGRIEDLNRPDENLKYRAEQIQSKLLPVVSKYQGGIWDELKPMIVELHAALQVADRKKAQKLYSKIRSRMDEEAHKVAQKHGIKYPSDGWQSSFSRYGWIR